VNLNKIVELEITLAPSQQIKKHCQKTGEGLTQ
jgi:hypothetical protein